jgi:CHAT domain-containing protein
MSYHGAVAATGIDAFDQANAAVELLRRAEAHTDPTLLNEAIALTRDVVAAVPVHHPLHTMMVTNLAAALHSRFGRTGVAADLDEAIHLCRATLGKIAGDNRRRVNLLNILGQALHDRCRQTGSTAHLDEAIHVSRAAVAAAGPDHPFYAVTRSDLGGLLRNRFERTGAMADLDEAIRLYLIAATAASDDERNRGVLLSRLGLGLRTRFEHTGVLADLDEAIRLYRAAITATPDDQPNRAVFQSNLGIALRTRYNRTGALADLDEAVRLYRAAITATPEGHPARAGQLFDLGQALHDRFERVGTIPELDQAIDLYRAAIATSPDTDPDRARYMSNLGTGLHGRFEHSGALADLNQAIDAHRAAVAGSGEGAPVRAAFLSNLGVALRTRFERTSTEADLDEAIDRFRAALAATPNDHPDRVKYLNNVGGALKVRYERAGAVADLDEAIELRRAAVAATPHDHPDRVMYLSNLGGVLMARGERTGAMADLDEAIELRRAAVAATPHDRPNRAGYLSNLALALVARFHRTGAVGDLDEAVDGWIQACSAPHAPVTARLIAAREWGQAAARKWGPAAAVTAYTIAVDLLPLLAWRGIEQHDQQRLLDGYATAVARDGAACAIAADRLDLAVELLEAGRAMHWSQLLGTRTDLTGLSQHAPDLARQLRDCRTLLDESSSDPSAGAQPHLHAEARMQAGRRFAHLVEQVRALPSAEAFPRPDRFLKPPSLPDLLPADPDDRIVVVNVSQWRCDALVLTRDGVNLVPLPELTEERVVDRTNQYLDALHEYERGLGASGDRLRLERAITTTLEWLWDHITAPILEQLGHTSVPTGVWPRLWWCPTGPLTLLPIHAAGHHDRHLAVLDRVVSSYTPTVQALAHARTRTRSSQPAKMLVVALPHTPNQSPLAGAISECDLLTAAVTSHTLLVGPAATRADILAEVRRHRWIHAACHGTQNLADPATGGLVPYDWNTAGLITIKDLANAGQTGGEFAFLAACKTAAGGITNLDEAITIASAMQHAGWRHLVATLWSVYDQSTAEATTAFYDLLAVDGALDPTGTAQALHQTVRRLRDAYPTSPTVWASFIHAGP